jgi:hypothetical protein
MNEERVNNEFQDPEWMNIMKNLTKNKKQNNSQESLTKKEVLINNMNNEKINGNTKKPYLLIDSSYVSFHRFFSTLIWYNNIYQKEEDDDYDWSENPVFMKYFNETYMKSLLRDIPRNSGGRNVRNYLRQLLREYL